MLFQDALAARLELIKPSRKIVESCLADHPLRLTPGVKDFISALHHRGVAVYLVSGGFRQVKALCIFVCVLVIMCTFEAVAVRLVSQLICPLVTHTLTTLRH